VRAASSAASGLTGFAISGINNAESAPCDVAVQGANINFVIDNAVAGKFDSSKNLLMGTTSPINLWSSSATGLSVKATSSNAAKVAISTSNANNTTAEFVASFDTNEVVLLAKGDSGYPSIKFYQINDATERTPGMFDSSGNWLIGATTSSCFGDASRITRSGGQGVNILAIDGGVEVSGIFQAVSGAGANTADCALRLGKNTVTNRSINAGGTINASGADAAEYECNGGLKIAKGQIVGFGPDGVLTDRFDAAIRFGVKSTDPHIVGGDTWGTKDKIGERPEKPAALHEDATEQEAQAHAQAVAKYQIDIAAFSARLEAARQQVDRIAYCGKVPCNVTGAAPGDYIVAVNDGSGGIKGLPVRSPTFDQYRAAVGRVNRILPDGRAEIAVIVH